MKAHAQMGDTVRRLLALAAVIALIAVGCSSDDTTTTTETEETTPTETEETTPTEADPSDLPSTLGGKPGVQLAIGGSDTLTGDSVALAGPFDQQQGNFAIARVSSLGDINAPELSVSDAAGNPVELSISDEKWDVDGGCAYARGQILMTSISAETAGEIGFPEPGQFEEAPSLGDIGGKSIVIATVPDGSEFENIQRVIATGSGMASFHYPMSPSPRWKYGPATVVTPKTGDPALAATQPQSAEVVVLDRFDSQATDRSVPDELQTSSEATKGHGEFIVGILARLGVGSIPKNVILSNDTVASEESVAIALAGTSDHVTNLSLGIAPCDRDGIEYPPIGVAAALIKRTAGSNTALPVVAAAGNHGVADKCEPPWFPAYFAAGETAWAQYLGALEAGGVFGQKPDGSDPTLDRAAVDDAIALLEDTTLSVGSATLDSVDGKSTFVRASYSGCDALDGVTSWAPGTNVISDYVDGNFAVWSGTSFAAPQIAAAKALGHM